MHMLSDKKEYPFGVKLIEFLLYNLVWFVIFSTIYWSINPMDWWIVKSIWGRVLLIFLQITLIEKSFGKKTKNKSEQ